MAISKMSWEDFSKAGLLWFVNRILHVFGWAIVLEIEADGKVFNCYPARVTFRGFEVTDEEKNYEKVARFLRENAKELYDEAKYKTEPPVEPTPPPGHVRFEHEEPPK